MPGADARRAQVRRLAQSQAKAKAKTKAANSARIARANDRGKSRHAAVKEMNRVAKDAAVAPVNVKAPWKVVERLIKTLQARSLAHDGRARLLAAARRWQTNGGKLDGRLVLTRGVSGAEGNAVGGAAVPTQEEAAADVVLLAKHKILLSSFRLESRAFMLTYNSRDLSPAAWESLLAFTEEKSRRFNASAFGVCMEITLHPSNTRGVQPGGAGGAGTVYHAHSYFYWKGADGVRLRDIDVFVFNGIRPNVKVNVARNPAEFRVAAMHGLWYVSVLKLGTVLAMTNMQPFQGYTPLPQWLTALWHQRKLSHEQYEELSAQIRIGHASRMQDLASVRRTERAVAVRSHVRREAIFNYNLLLFTCLSHLCVCSCFASG